MFLILVTSRPNFNLSFTQPESIKVFLFFLNLAFFTSVAFLEIQNTKILQRLVSWNSQIKQRKMSTQSSLTTTENGHKIHFSFFPELSVINHVSQSSSADVAVSPRIWPPVIQWLKFHSSCDDNYSCSDAIFSSQYRFCLLPTLCRGYIVLWLDILCDTPSRILQEAFTSWHWCQNNPIDDWAAISVATVWDIHCIITVSDNIAVSRYYMLNVTIGSTVTLKGIKTNGYFELNNHFMIISQFIMSW